MNTKDIEKREELCRLLNMNFDEADELFSDETMQSMQMAQVNGGGFWGVLGQILLEHGVFMATEFTISYVITQLQTAPTAALVKAGFNMEQFMQELTKMQSGNPNMSISVSWDSLTTNANGKINVYGFDFQSEPKQ